MKQISDQTKLHLPPQKVKNFCGDTRIRATLSGSDCKGMFLVNQLNTNNVFIYSRIKIFFATHLQRDQNKIQVKT